MSAAVPAAHVLKPLLSQVPFWELGSGSPQKVHPQQQVEVKWAPKLPVEGLGGREEQPVFCQCDNARALMLTVHVARTLGEKWRMIWYHRWRLLEGALMFPYQCLREIHLRVCQGLGCSEPAELHPEHPQQGSGAGRLRPRRSESVLLCKPARLQHPRF